MRFAIRIVALIGLWPVSLGAGEVDVRPQGPAIVRADSAALILSGQDGGAIPLAVVGMPHPMPAGNMTAAVWIEAGGAALIEGHQGSVLRVDVFVYALGLGNEMRAHATAKLALDVGRWRSELDRTGLRLGFNLALTAGEYRLRVLVRAETGAFGLSGSRLAIPDRTEPHLLPPLVARPVESWITAVSESDEAVLASVWHWLDGSSPGDAPPAAGRTVLTAEKDHELVAVLSGAASDTGAGDLVAALEDGTGQVEVVELKAIETAFGEPVAGVRAWRAWLRPPALEPGIYELSTSLGKIRSPPVPVVLLPAGFETADAEPPAWPRIDLEGLSPGIELPPAEVDLGGSQHRVLDDEVVAGYLEALRHLAAEDRDAALRRLYELETRILALFESTAVDGLEKLETETLAALLGRSAKAGPVLLPIILLHAEAVRGYRRAARSALVRHSEHMVLRLTRTYVERLRGEEARRDAVTILLGIAAEIRRLGTLTRAAEIYRHALEVDPESEDVALALAAIHEKLGRAGAAVEILEQAGRKRLGPEARLRLAINLRRTRRREKAEKILRQLAAEAGAARWIRVLAVQELARAALDRDRAGDAAEILRRGLLRWPGHPGLELLLAYALDRLGQTAEATELLEAIGNNRSPGDTNERYRYHEWPRSSLDAARREMAARASRQLAALGTALEEVQGRAGDD